MTDETRTYGDAMPRVLDDIRNGVPVGKRFAEERRRRREIGRANGIPEHDLPPLVDDHGRLL